MQVLKPEFVVATLTTAPALVPAAQERARICLPSVRCWISCRRVSRTYLAQPPPTGGDAPVGVATTW